MRFLSSLDGMCLLLLWLMKDSRGCHLCTHEVHQIKDVEKGHNLTNIQGV